jgi:putative transcriptional regulator
MQHDADEIIARIAGEIVLSHDPGMTMKVWRQRLKVKQSELAKAMGISPSVLSDYESGRRVSPGVGFVRRYVECLIRLDKSQGNIVRESLTRKEVKAIISMGEFKKPVKAKKVAEVISANVLVGNESLDANIYGYTVLDSIKAIYALSGFEFYRIFGSTTERVIVFTKVGLGRSPLVAIRVSPLKPRMVVIHGPRNIDPLAIDLAQREKIILALSSAKKESDIVNSLTEI